MKSLFRVDANSEFASPQQKLRRLIGIFVALAMFSAGLSYAIQPAHAATAAATVSPQPTVDGWNSSGPVTFSMVTQSTLATYAGGGYGSFYIDSSYTINFPSTSVCSGVLAANCPDASFSVTKSDNTVMSFPSATLTATTGGFMVAFNENNSIPAGSTLSISFPTNKVYFYPHSKYIMATSTYGYTPLDTSVSASIFNSVTYHTNYGADATSLQGGIGQQALTYNPSRSGYVFQGWSATSSGSVIYASGAMFDFSAATNTHLYAIWALASQTVTFNANGGTGTLSAQVASSATNLSSNTFTRAGYTFAGWNTLANGTGTSYANGASYPFTASTTLYAKWTANTNAVTYDPQGGSAVPGGTFVTGGSIATLPTAPERPGYTHTGWFPTSSGGSALANGYAPSATGAITIYSQWAPNTNTVTYDSHGGTAVAPGSFVTGGSIATLPAAPTRAGYTFLGWFLSDSGGTALANGYSPSATAAITLHAQWQINSRTVTFNANGGAGTMAAQTSVSPAAISANSFSRAGFAFMGWNTAANGSGTAYAAGANFPFSSNETLYAQWRELPPVPIAAVDIQIPVGAAIANAPVALDIDGLKDESGYVVTVFSTPQIVDQGTIWSGRLNTTVRIPSNLEPGWHRLVIDGTAADGTPWTEVNFFKVSESGLLLATSEVVPAELAYTGAKQTTGGILGGTLLAVGLMFVGTRLVTRRRKTV